MGGDERLRLFLGLRLPEDALDVVEAWQLEHLERMRIVPRAHLHVTLAFLGGRPAAELPGILDALRAAAGVVEGEIRLTPVRYRETRAVAMLVCDDEEGRGGRLAADLQVRLERLGVYRREGRPWLPHLTVGRFRERPGLRPEPPNMGTYVLIPSGLSAYLSRLRPGGAQSRDSGNGCPRSVKLNSNVGVRQSRRTRGEPARAEGRHRKRRLGGP